MKLKGFINSKSGAYDVMHEAAKMLQKANFVLSDYYDIVENHLSERDYKEGIIRNYKSDPTAFLVCAGIISKKDGKVTIENKAVFSKYLESYSTAIGAHSYAINKTLVKSGVPIVEIMENFYKDNDLEKVFINFVTAYSKEVKMKKSVEEIVNAFKLKDTDTTKHHMIRLSYVIGYNNLINKVNKWCTSSYKYAESKKGLPYELATNKANGKRKGQEFENSYIDNIDIELAIKTYNDFNDSITIEVDFDSSAEFEEELKSFYEGHTKSQIIERRVRNTDIVKIVKKEHSDKNDGRLPCQDCGYCFSDDDYTPYIEAHHIKPFASNKGKVKINKEDFVLLCPNCHKKRHQDE